MSTELSAIKIGQRFSFEVYPSAILGNNFNDVTLDSIMSPESARSFGVDIFAMHANVYRTLPSIVPNDPLKYSWVRVKMPNGGYIVLGEPYIRAESIVISSTGVLNLSFIGVSQTDQTRILNALSANGYKPDLNELVQQ